MFKTLRSLIGVHHKGDATVAEIETALAGAHAEISAAEHARAEAVAAYKAGLLALEDEQAQRLVADREAAELRRDRALALVEALTEKLTSTRAAEEQAGRRAAYEAADKAQAAAVKVLAADYPRHARALAELLRVVAEADALAEVANADLPDGADRLLSVEGRVRREPDMPARIASDEAFSAWCYSSGQHVHADDQGTLTPNSDGRTGTWKPFGGGTPVPVSLRRFRRVVTLPEAPGRDIASLAATLNLPPLRATSMPYWPAGGADGPRGILARLAELAPGWGKRVGAGVLYEPAPETKIIPLDDAASAA